jgi:hypothetical protein
MGSGITTESVTFDSDLYDNPTYTEPASAIAIDWFGQHLN